jgi:hypothetical protein
MMPRFELRSEWIDPPPEGDAFGPERSTWAKLAIEIDGTSVTNHYRRKVEGDPKEARETVTGAMSGLADWLVENWGQILWEVHTPFPKVVGDAAVRVPSLRDVKSGQVADIDYGNLASWLHRHTLGHGNSDLAVPTLMFLPEDRVVGVVATAPSYELNPTVSFAVQWPKEPVWVPKDELVSTLGTFIEATIEHASLVAATQPWAEWLRKNFEKARTEVETEDARRRLMLGRVVADQWQKVSSRLGENTEALAGVLADSAMISDVAALEALTGAVETATQGASGTSAWRKLTHEPGSSLLPPYERGYRLAASTRRLLGEPDRPLRDLRDVLARLDVRLAAFDGAGLFRSACTVGSQGAATVFCAEDPNYGGVAPTRFAVAAALGRLLSGHAKSSFGAAHGSQSAYQRTQEANAFAAEFLLPVEALAKSANIQALSEDYGISKKAAEKHRNNRVR